MLPKTFICGCAQCRQDGGGEPLCWRRAAAPRSELEWKRTSRAAWRGYLNGRVTQIVYVWGKTYDCVPHDPGAQPVPWILFVCVQVVNALSNFFFFFEKKNEEKARTSTRQHLGHAEPDGAARQRAVQRVHRGHRGLVIVEGEEVRAVVNPKRAQPVQETVELHLCRPLVFF